MKKLIVLTTVFVFLIIFVVPFAAALFIKIIPDNDQPPFDINNKRAIYSYYDISQVFTSQENYLTAIGISLGNPNLKNKNEIIFNLKDAGGITTRQIKISGANVQDGNFIKFVFDPIPDSKGKQFIFSISSPSAGPEEILNVYFSSEKTSWIGPATYGEEVIDTGLPIVTYHKVPSHIKVALDVFSSWIRRVY